MNIPKNWKANIARERSRALRALRKMGQSSRQLLLPMHTEESVVVWVFEIPEKVKKHISRLAAISEDAAISKAVRAAIDKVDAARCGVPGAAADCDTGGVAAVLDRLDAAEAAALEYCNALSDLMERLSAVERARAPRNFDSFYTNAIVDTVATPNAFRRREVATGDLVKLGHVIHGVLVDVTADTVERVINENAWAGHVLTWLVTRLRDWLDRNPDYTGECKVFFTQAELERRFGISHAMAHKVLYGGDGSSGVVGYLTRESVKIHQKSGSSFPLCWFANISKMSDNEEYRDILEKYSGRTDVLCAFFPSLFVPYVRRSFRVDVPGAWYTLPSRARSLAFSLAFQWARNDYSSGEGDATALKRLGDMRDAGALLPGRISVRRACERFFKASELPDAARAEAERKGLKFKAKEKLLDPFERRVSEMAGALGVPVDDVAWYEVNGRGRCEIGSLAFADWWDAVLVFDRSSFPFDRARVESSINDAKSEILARKFAREVRKVGKKSECVVPRK